MQLRVVPKQFGVVSKKIEDVGTGGAASTGSEITFLDVTHSATPDPNRHAGIGNCSEARNTISSTAKIYQHDVAISFAFCWEGA